MTCAWGDVAPPSLSRHEPKMSTMDAPRSGSLIAEALFPRVTGPRIDLLSPPRSPVVANERKRRGTD